MRSPKAPSYNVVIVGAGFAGLNSGIALALKGHKVTIIERTSSLQNIGLGMLTPPQASRILDGHGIFEELLKMDMIRDGIAICRYADGSVIGRSKFKWQKEVYGYP
jgi:salicylate hydroxylase